MSLLHFGGYASILRVALSSLLFLFLALVQHKFFSHLCLSFLWVKFQIVWSHTFGGGCGFMVYFSWFYLRPPLRFATWHAISLICFCTNRFGPQFMISGLSCHNLEQKPNTDLNLIWPLNCMSSFCPSRRERSGLKSLVECNYNHSNVRKQDQRSCIRIDDLLQNNFQATLIPILSFRFLQAEW